MSLRRDIMSPLLCCGFRKLSDFNMQIIIIVKLKKYCGSPEQKSSIIPSHISTALPILTHYSTVLPLRVGLIHTSWSHQIFMYLHIAYQPRPQQKLSAIDVKLGDVLEIIDEIIIFDFLPHCSFLSMHISSAMTYFITTESQASLVVG